MNVADIQELFKLNEELAKLPPAPRALVASHEVPYGRIYRQWDTRGDLFIWVNRGEIADLPRASHRPGPFQTSASIFSIPVRNA